MTEETKKLLEKMKKKRGYIEPWQEFMAEEDTDFIRAYEEVFDKIGVRSVALPIKYKLLILIGVLCAQRDQASAKTQIKRAFRLGATKEEIIEAIEMAYLPSGAPTLIHGIKALIDVLKEQSNPQANAQER